MNHLQIFNYEQSDIRTILINNEPWWVAKDVCDVLEHSNSRMALDRLDEDEKGVSSIYTPGGTQEMQIINEPGLYSLILGSRKPEAKAFKRWITHEVIPAIRNTGSYSSAIVPKSQAEMLLMYAQQNLENERRLNEISTSVDTIKETILHEPDKWREEINRMLNRVSAKMGKDHFRLIRIDSYKYLEGRARVDLERREMNLKARLLSQGANKTALNKVCKLDVIEADPKLREIYTGIVKALLIKHCA